MVLLLHRALSWRKHLQALVEDVKRTKWFELHLALCLEYFEVSFACSRNMISSLGTQHEKFIFERELGVARKVAYTN